MRPLNPAAEFLCFLVENHVFSQSALVWQPRAPFGDGALCPDDHVYFHHGWAAHGRRPPPLEMARSPQGGEVSPQEAKFREEGRGEEVNGREGCAWHENTQ